MTEHTIDELRSAEVVEGHGGPNAYLVRFGEDEYEMVNRTPRNRLLLETDLLAKAENGDTREVGDDYVTFAANVDEDRYTVTVNGDRVVLPSDVEGDAIEAYAADDYAELRNIHEDVVSNRVRVGLMDRFMPRFAEEREEGRLHKSKDGWVVDDTFVVSWDGNNYLTDNVDTHVVQGGEAVRADESREAREIRFDLPETVEVDYPNGGSVELGQREARFLATAECLLNPSEYLTDEEADYVERAVENVRDPIASLARTARVTGFTDEKSGLYHAHGLQKHRLADLGVTEAAKERLFYNDFDHAGVHEMKARRNEFEHAAYSVFEDAANDDLGKWQKIEATSRKAPIPQDVRADIDSRFQ